MNASESENKSVRLSPARFGEAMAWLGYFPPKERAEVLRCLGSDEETFARDAGETRALLSTSLEKGDLGPVLNFARAFDLTDRRARARRPRVGAIRAHAHLEPSAEPRRPIAVPNIVPLASTPANAELRATTPTGVPTYLRREQEATPSPEASLAGNALAMTSAPTTADMIAPAEPPTSPSPAPSAAVLPFQRALAPVSSRSSAPPPPVRLDTGTLRTDDASGPTTLAPKLKPFASVTRYAGLVAELRGAPANAESILVRAGLETSDERGEVHRYWRVTFDADPALRARFERLCEALMRKRA